MSIFAGGLKKLASCGQQPTLEKVFGAKITLCGDIIGHRIKSRILFAEALNTSKIEESGKVLFDGQETIIPHNTRLAIYGDAAIRAHLSRLWYLQGSETSCGLWGKVSSRVLSDSNLIEIYHQYNIRQCVHYSTINKGIIDPISRIKPKATTVEAILGAAHLDGGDAALDIAMTRLGMTAHPIFSARGLSESCEHLPVLVEAHA